MQQATNTPLKGTKKITMHKLSDQHQNTCNSRTSFIKCRFKWTNSTFLYIQQIKSMYLLNVKSAYQCIKEISKQCHGEEREKWTETKTSLRKKIYFPPQTSYQRKWAANWNGNSFKFDVSQVNPESTCMQASY